MRGSVLGVAVVGALMSLACGEGAEPIEYIEYDVVATFPHDTLAYTQGLEVDGREFLESTGRYGESTLRRVDIVSGTVSRSVALDSAYFGEGLARVGDEVFQLTWKAGRALVYDAETLELLRTVEYRGEGWGLCYDGQSLYMSNGSDHLVRRDPASFEPLDSLQVTASGISVFSLNELECVGDFIFANVFMTDRIVKIEKATGRVVGEIDASSLTLRTRRGRDPEAVLNGIAYIAETGTFLLTGKLWPTVYGVRLRD
jgi:glutamine cyclotransferase